MTTYEIEVQVKLLCIKKEFYLKLEHKSDLSFNSAIDEIRTKIYDKYNEGIGVIANVKKVIVLDKKLKL